jgi:hypothetical protein
MINPWSPPVDDSIRNQIRFALTVCLYPTAGSLGSLVIGRVQFYLPQPNGDWGIGVDKESFVSSFHICIRS